MTAPVRAPGPRHLAPPARRGPRALPHLPALDGLRGLALLGVLLFHADRLRGGFLGVDLFFVLSGFLITSLLLGEAEARGRVDLPRFWSRRARRLAPALLVVVAASAAYAAALLDGGALARFRGDALATLADVANWREIATGADYWRAYEAPSPLRHTWSLAIEEQVYLLWPIVVAALLALGRRRHLGRQPLVVATAGLALASYTALALLARTGDTARAYFGTDARAGAVLLGALGATLLGADRIGDRRAARALALLGPPAAVGVGLLWATTDGTALGTYRWGLPLHGVLGLVLVLAAVHAGDGLLGRALASAPLRRLGGISYGTYLWHWPAYLVVDRIDGLDGVARTVVQVAVSLALGVASLRFVEEPVRSGRVPTARWRVLGLGGLAATVALVLVVTWGARPDPTGGADGAVSSGLATPVDARPRVLLLGDSQALRLGEVGPEVLGPDVELGQYSLLGCGIGPGLATADGRVERQDLVGVDCTEALARFRTAVDQQRPDLVVLHAGAWDVLDRDVGGQRLAFGTAAWDDAVTDNLRRVLTELDRGPQRLLVLAAPCFDPVGADGGPPARGDDRRVERWNELLRAVAAEQGVTVAPLDELFCLGPGTHPEEPARRDGVHLAPDGARAVWRWLVPQLRLDELVGTRAGSGRP